MALALGTNSGFVTVAPTADPAATGATIDGNAVVTKDTAPAGAVKITSIGWYRASGTNAANWEIALYSDLAGVPVSRLFVDATNSSTSGGWLTTVVDWDITPSTPYWLALQMDAHSGSSQVDSAASGGAGSDLFAASTLADPYAGGAVADADGMYAIYALVSVPVTHTTTGAVSAQSATVAGAAARTAAFVTHVASGSVSAQSATADGVAKRYLPHAATGAVLASSATSTGAAKRYLPHAASGAVLSSAATTSGAAKRFAIHVATGTVTAGSASVSGSASGAVDVVTHDATGAVIAQSASVSGESYGGSAVVVQSVPVGGINRHSRDRFRSAPAQRAARAARATGPVGQRNLQKREHAKAMGILAGVWSDVPVQKSPSIKLMEVEFVPIDFDEDEDLEALL